MFSSRYLSLPMRILYIKVGLLRRNVLIPLSQSANARSVGQDRIAKT